MKNEIKKRSSNIFLMLVLVLFYATPAFADELQFGTDDPDRVVEGQTLQFSLNLITDVAGCTAEGVIQQVQGNAEQDDDWAFVNSGNFNISETESVMSFELLAIDDDEAEEDEQLVLDAILETTTCAQPFETTSLKTITIEDNDQQQNTGNPASIEVISGSGQMGSSGQPLEPIRVRVNDENGNPVANREVEFRVRPANAGGFECEGNGNNGQGQGGGNRQCDTLVVTTDANGEASVNFTPDSDNSFTIEVGVVDTGITTSVNIEGNGGGTGGNAGEPSGIEVLSGSGQSGSNGQALDPIVVQINDADGNPVSDQEVQVSVSPEEAGSFDCEGQQEASCTLTSDASGQVTVNFTPATDEDFSLDIDLVGTGITSSVSVASSVQGGAGGGNGGGNAGEPSGIEVLSGSGQSGSNGQALDPIVVQINDADGNPVSDQEVQVSVNPEEAGTFDCEGQQTASCTLTSDASGQVTVNFTPATDEGFSLAIDVVGTDVTSSVSVEGGAGDDGNGGDDGDGNGGSDDVAAGGEPGGGQGQSGGVGDTLDPVSVTALQADGTPAVGVPVVFTVTPADGGTFENGENTIEVLTDDNGEASASLTLATDEGVTISAQVENVDEPVEFEVTGSDGTGGDDGNGGDDGDGNGGSDDVAAGGEPGGGQGQSGGVGDTLDPVSVTALQADGTPAVGVPVVFTVTPADGGTFENGENTIEVLTDDNGEASASLTLATDEGVTISAQVENVDQPVLFDVAAEEVVLNNVISLSSGDGQAGNSETDLEPLVVEVVDEEGNPVAGAEVSWEIIAGQAEFAEGGITASTTTSENGQASIDVNLLANEGAAIRATLVSNGDAVTFSIDALEADELGETTVMSGGNQTGGNGSVLDPLVIQAVQPNGDPAANVEYLWTIRPQGAAEFQNGEDSIVLTTDAAGEAAAIVRLLTDNRVVITVQPVAGGAATIILVNGGIANIRGLTDNEQSLAEVLDDVCTDLFQRDTAQGLTDANEQDLLNTCNQIQLAPDDETAAEAIALLTPTQASAAGSASVRIASSMAGNIGARLMALRKNSNTSLNVAGLDFTYDGKTIPSGSLAQSWVDGELRGGAAGDANLASPWGMFINGEVSFGDKSDSENEAGFDFEIPSLTVGVDYRYSNEMVFGAALGYSNTQADFNDDAGDLDLENINLSVYGTYYNLNGFYIDGLVKLGFNNFQTNRKLSTAQTAQGDTDGNDFAINLSGGFNKNKGGTSYGAYARASYLQLDIDGYSETASDPNAAGAGSILMFGSQSIDSLITVAGATVSHAISTERAVIVPQLTLEWEHEFADDAREISASFVFDPNNQFFEISTDSPDRDYLNLGIGFSMVTKGGKSAYLIYERKIDQTDIEQNTIKGGLRFEF